MSLRRALLLSLCLHLFLGVAAGYAIRSLSGALEPVREQQGTEIAFNLVDPASTRLGEEDVAPAALDEGARGITRAAPASSPAARRRAGAGGPEGERSTAREEPASDLDDETAVAPITESPGELPSASAASAKGRRRPAVAPGRLQPRELAQRVGLDTEGLDEPVLERMFSAMHKYALESPRPAASTYRQLLRAWIDGLMGYPYPVLEDLARNAEHRFIGGIRIEVRADGSFRLAELWIYDGIVDPDERMAGYYSRIIREATVHRFLPPSDAGLPAPHGLEYRIVNPRARR